MHVSSLQNPRVKAAAKLRERKARDRQQRFLIDGIRELSLALDAGAQIEELFVCESLCDTAAAETLLRRFDAADTQVLTVTQSRVV